MSLFLLDVFVCMNDMPFFYEYCFHALIFFAKILLERRIELYLGL